MARIEVHADRLVIQMTPAERALSMHRRDIVIDRARITSALITDDPWVWLRGSRTLGTRFSNRQAHGTWRHLSGRDFAILRKGRHAVVIDMDEPSAAEQQAVTQQAASGDDGAAAPFDRVVGAHTAAFESDDFVRVIVSTDHAADLVRALRLGEGDGDDLLFATETA